MPETTDFEAAGMRWWNSLPESERRAALEAADLPACLPVGKAGKAGPGASVADAYRLYLKRLKKLPTEPCPCCSNNNPELFAVVTEGGPFSRAAQESHEKYGRPKQQVRLLGRKCAKCGFITRFDCEPAQPNEWAVQWAKDIERIRAERKQRSEDCNSL